MAERGSEVRATDAERDQVASLLREQLLTDSLDQGEFSRRLSKAYAATTLTDLDELLRDLPLTINPPIPPPTTRYQRRLVRQYQQRLGNWEKTRAVKRSHLNLARGGDDLHHNEFPCQPGEKILARVTQTALKVWTTTAGHTELRTTTNYSRTMFGGGRQTGKTTAYEVPGRDTQVTADVGALYVSNQRIGFRGPKQTVDIPVNAAAGISVDPGKRSIIVSLAGDRPITFRYPRDPSGLVVFSTDLALAYRQGSVGSLVSRLESELAELDRSKPVIPSEALEPPTPKAQRIKRVAKAPKAARPARAPRSPREPRVRPVRAEGTRSSRRRIALVSPGGTRGATRAWMILQAWWVLLTLPLGLTTWAAFWYAGHRARRRDLLIAAAAYGFMLILGFVLSGLNLSTAGGAVFACLWIAGIVHALVVLRSVSRKLLTARIAQLAGAAQASSITG